MAISDREHREALTRAGDAEERAAKAERERDDAREDARVTHHRARVACQALVEEIGADGPGSVEDAAARAVTVLRARWTREQALYDELRTVTRERDEARAVIAAACAALGASATGDLAADVARVARALVVAERDRDRARDDRAVTRRECDAGLAEANELVAAAEATLRETTVALERVQRDLDAARDTLDGYERDDYAVRRAVGALPFSSADGNSRHLRLTLWEPTARRGTLSVAVGDSHEGTNAETAIGAIAGAVRSIAARIEAPTVEAAVPHRAWNDALGVWWCDVDGCTEHLRGPQRAPVEAAVVLTPDDVRRTLAEGDTCRADIEARMRRPVAPYAEAVAEARGHLEDARDRVDSEGTGWAYGAAMDALRSLGGDPEAREAEAPDVDSAPHRVGDTWRLGDSGREGEVRRLHDVEPVLLSLHVREATSLTVMTWRTVDELRDEGWRRIRCAPAVGDAVHVGEGVEGVATGGDVAGESGA